MPMSAEIRQDAVSRDVQRTAASKRVWIRSDAILQIVHAGSSMTTVLNGMSMQGAHACTARCRGDGTAMQGQSCGHSDPLKGH